MAEEQNLKSGGTLQVTVKEGKLLRNTELIGKMDPFILITYNSEKFKTNVIQEGGMAPVWNCTLPIPILQFDKAALNFKCFDEDVGKDDFIGEANFKASQLIREFNRTKASKLILKYNNSPAAEINIEAKFIPSITQGVITG